MPQVSQEEATSSSSAPSASGKIYEVIANEDVRQLGMVPTALPPNPFILRHLEPGSWAEQNGISVGDELIALNDVRVATINLKELDDFLRRRRPLRLTLVCKKVSQVEPMTDNEFKELKRASTGEIEDFVERNDDQSSHKVTLGEPVSANGILSGFTSQDPAMDAMVGTWIYSQAYEYTIDQRADGFHFEEARTDEETGAVQRVTGQLRPSNSWLLGEIYDSERRQRGYIRLRYVEEDGTVISNVQLPNEDQWSGEMVATRKRDHHVSEGMAADEEACQAHPQILDGKRIWPEQWGITRAQCIDLLRRLERDPEWDPQNTMRTLVSSFVVPWTRGQGVGYALMQNQDDPKEVNLMVSHSWSENAEEFLRTLGRSTRNDDVMWVCALSMYHAADGVGPSIRQQLGCTPEESPFRRVLQHIRTRGQSAGAAWRFYAILHQLPVFFMLLALVLFYVPILIWGCVPSIDGGRCLLRRMLEVDGKDQASWHWSEEYEEWSQTSAVLSTASYPATAFCVLSAAGIWLLLWRLRVYHGRLLAVPGTESDLYSRLWCVHEVSTAAALGVPIVLANTLAWTGKCETRSASCSEKSDTDRILKILEKEAQDGHEQVDGVLRRSLRQEQCRIFLALLGWALPLVCFRCADQRLLSVSAGSLIGASGLHFFFTGALGVLAGVSCCCLVMYTTARLEKGSPTYWAVGGAVFFLVVLSAIITAALIYFEDLRQVPPENWIHGLDYFFDECFGHLRLNAPSSSYPGCSRLSRFWGAFTQTLLLGGIFLLVFLVGAVCCPPFMKGFLQAAIFSVVAATALLTTSFYAETEPPQEERIFSVVVFYSTALFSRSLAPILAMWAGVSTWGITLYSRRRRRPPSSS